MLGASTQIVGCAAEDQRKGFQRRARLAEGGTDARSIDDGSRIKS